MGLYLEAENEASATPKLSLYKLPSKQKEPLVMFTPPMNTLASIPFQWEEAPGKPRADFTTSSTPVKNKNSVARCLDLPPRLLNNITSSNDLIDHPRKKVVMTNVSSPTTVLDGPYRAQSFSRSSTFSSLPKGSFKRLEEQSFREVNYQQHHHDINVNRKRDTFDKERYGSVTFASWRWGSYKENNTGRSSATNDNFDFTSSVNSFTSKSHRSSSPRPPRFKRRSSFLSFSQASSNILAGIYGSFKQVVPWRRKQERNKA